MRRKIYSFENLQVWADIRKMIKDVYKLTAAFPEIEKFGLVIQMRRAAISVSSNLAEGSSRTSPKDQANFYQIAYSSMLELLSQLIVSYDLNFVSESIYLTMRQDIEGITYKLNSLRSASLKRINPK